MKTQYCLLQLHSFPQFSRQPNKHPETRDTKAAQNKTWVLHIVIAKFKMIIRRELTSDPNRGMKLEEVGLRKKNVASVDAEVADLSLRKLYLFASFSIQKPPYDIFQHALIHHSLHCHHHHLLLQLLLKTTNSQVSTGRKALNSCHGIQRNGQKSKRNGSKQSNLNGKVREMDEKKGKMNREQREIDENLAIFELRMVGRERRASVELRDGSNAHTFRERKKREKGHLLNFFQREREERESFICWK